MSDDLYDFSGVTFDLQLLKSELKSLQATTNRHIGLYNKSQVTTAHFYMAFGNRFEGQFEGI